jgi:hypothetical protein
MAGKNVLNILTSCARAITVLISNQRQETPMNPHDEQDERIREAMQDWHDNPQDYSLSDLEDMFEDRDPVEFF